MQAKHKYLLVSYFVLCTEEIFSSESLLSTLSSTIKSLWDFCGGTVDKNLPSGAWDMGLISGKILRAVEQLSPCTTTEPTL